MFWHSTYGAIAVIEQVFYQKRLKKNIRAFSSSSGVSCRGYSRALSRAITDFGNDNAFGKVEFKLKEHYGIEVPTSSSRIITQHHAHNIYEQEQQDDVHICANPQAIILAETDGSMIPIVKCSPKPDGVEKFDARKHKTHFWRETRLSLARAVSSVTPVFAATLDSVDKVGRQLKSCVNKVGCNEKTRIHCVGDGAPWIANQVEEQFGTQATYLVDFYHVCEYLCAAASKCGGKEWVEKRKTDLKSGFLENVLQSLKQHIECESVEDSDAPVRRCYRYLANRRNQLDYQRTIKDGLPIGSGEVESAHRYVIQSRLKLSGAWWKEVNAADMLALRINKANRNWEKYWLTQKLA